MIPAHLISGSPRLRWDSSVKLTWVGNSLFAGYGVAAGSSLPLQALNYPPLRGSLVGYANTAVTGFRWESLISGNYSDTQFAADKTNVCVVWEGTNSIVDANRTAAQAFAYAQQWTAARLALHPTWRIFHVTCLPRYGTYNQVLLDYNSLLMNGWRAMGAAGCIDVRNNVAFCNVPGTSTGDFPATYWVDTIHPNATGLGLLAAYIASELGKLKRL